MTSTSSALVDGHVRVSRHPGTPRPAMSNPNGLLSQKVNHYLDKGRILNDIFLRAAHWMAYFDHSKPILA